MADKVRLRRAECCIARMMCSTRLVGRASSADMQQRVGVDRTIEELIVQNQFCWYGHLLHHGMDNPIPQVL